MRTSISPYCLAAILLVAGLSACQSVPSRLEGSVNQRIEEALAENTRLDDKRKGVDIPPDVSHALLPPLTYAVRQGDMKPVERRFDVRANNAPARELFVGLAEGTPYSVVVHPDVAGTISLDLKGVTLIEALEVLRTVHGYAYKRDGNRLIILGQGLRTEIFSVNYLNFTRRGNSQTTVSSAQLTQGGSSGEDSSAGESGGGGSGGGGISVQTASQSNFWQEMKETLEVLIGDDLGRKVVVNPQSSLVIVRALPAELDLVEEYLGVTHATINRQVILEAKILEVQLEERFQAGINWAVLNNANELDFLAAQTGGASLLDGSGAGDITGRVGELISEEGFAAIDAKGISAFGGIFSLALRKSNDFAAFVELLKSQGDVHVLSSPRVATVNNQKAVIKVGGDEFFITGITQTTTTTGASTTEVPEVQLKAFFSGIALDVTPQIDDEDNVILHIHPSISEVDQQNKNFVLGDQAFVLPLAVSSIQESDNVVRARSGQIIVIGGLMKEATTEGEATVPLLGDLPFVGNIFKQKKLSRIKKELVILLKPTVVEGGDLWRKAVEESRDRLVKLEEAPKR